MSSVLVGLESGDRNAITQIFIVEVRLVARLNLSIPLFYVIPQFDSKLSRLTTTCMLEGQRVDLSVAGVDRDGNTKGLG